MEGVRIGREKIDIGRKKGCSRRKKDCPRGEKNRTGFENKGRNVEAQAGKISS